MEHKKIKPGEVLSSVLYMTVKEVTKDGIKVIDASNREFEVRGKNLIESTISSAAQYDTTKKVTRTEMAQILTNAGDSVFTVVFDKQNGEERTLVGHLVETENQMGRSNVADLQVASGYNMRQVDHRTLKSLILGGVRYTVKK